MLATSGELTDAEMLALLKQVRQQIILQMTGGQATIYIEIRNRRAQFSDPSKLLETINQMIRQFEQIVGGRSGRPTTNYAVLKKS